MILLDYLPNRIMRYDKAEPDRMQASPLEAMWPSWNKLQILGWKWCSKEPQAHITSLFKHFFFSSYVSFQSCWLEVSSIFRPSNFTPFSCWRSFSFSSPARGAAERSQDAVDEDGHDGGADQARDGHGHKPSHEDVPEQTPVDRLPWAQPAYGHHRAHLQTQQVSVESLPLPESRLPIIKQRRCFIFGPTARLLVWVVSSCDSDHRFATILPCSGWWRQAGQCLTLPRQSRPRPVRWRNHWRE